MLIIQSIELFSLDIGIRCQIKRTRMHRNTYQSHSSLTSVISGLDLGGSSNKSPVDVSHPEINFHIIDQIQPSNLFIYYNLKYT